MTWNDTPIPQFHGERPAYDYLVQQVRSGLQAAGRKVAVPSAPPVRCHKPVVRKGTDGLWHVHIRYRAPYCGGSDHGKRTWREAIEMALEYAR